MNNRMPLSHLLYTNAPGEGGSGLRFLGAVPGTQVERDRIKGWLMGLKLAGEQRAGWAINSFEVDRSPCFALAVVDSTRFPQDDIGRPGGILAHTLLVLIEEGKPAGDFGHAAFDKAQEFLEGGRSGSPMLSNYLQGCRVNTYLEIPDLQYNNFRGLDPRFLEIFYSAACDGGQGATMLFPGLTSDDQLPEHLLSASIALPPRLRLGLCWRVGLQAGKEGFVASIAPGSAALPAGNLGTAYLDAVREQLRVGQDDRVARFASSDWGVNTWNGLQQAFSRPEAETGQGIASPGSSAQLKESDMAKKGSSATGSKPAGAPRAKSQTAYDEEYQALEKDLRDYLDEQLTLLGAPPTKGSALRPPYIPGRGSWGDRNPAFRWYREWRPEIYFLVLLLLGSVALLQLRSPKGSPVNPQPTPSPSPTPEPSPRPFLPPAPPGDPLAAWKAFVESPEAVGWFQAVAEARGLASSQVSDSRKDDFNEWTETLAKEEHLKDAALVSSRTCFFEYAHARWAKDKGVGKTDQDVVTLNPEEVARNLKAMVKDLGLTGALGSNPTVGDAKVQAEVALAWIKRNPSEPWRRPSP